MGMFQSTQNQFFIFSIVYYFQQNPNTTDVAKLLEIVNFWIKPDITMVTKFVYLVDFQKKLIFLQFFPPGSYLELLIFVEEHSNETFQSECPDFPKTSKSFNFPAFSKAFFRS